MIYEIEAKSILRKHKRIDSWFISSYGINLYRGCTHNCVYCDGRHEKYQVNNQFGRDIEIKTNALELLDKELDPSRKRKPMNNGFVVICGGVSDSYQPLEKKYELTRKTLELLLKYKHPVHLLTKSTLIERDIDLIKKIDDKKKALVSFSFSTVENKLSKILEPGASSPQERLNTIKRFKDAGISCGMFLMPVVPFISDSKDMIEESVSKAKDAGVDYIIFGGMTLKEGKQKDYFMNFIQGNYPLLIKNFSQMYSEDNLWGTPNLKYGNPIEKSFESVATKYKIPKRIPAHLFSSLVTKTELAILILEQLDYCARIKGLNSPYRYSAHELHKLNQNIEDMSTDELLKIKGIGPVTEKIIREIIETGTSSFYKKTL